MYNLSPPRDEWKWHFEVPEFGIRFVALDLNHISDMGTTWQACHPFDKISDQFQWFAKLMAGSKPPFVVTLYNERNASVRAQEDGSWGEMLRQGTVAITGFGYFAERAEVDGFTCYNTSLSGKGARYPDPKSDFLASEDSRPLQVGATRFERATSASRTRSGRMRKQAFSRSASTVLLPHNDNCKASQTSAVFVGK